jgi:serine protease AprX
MAAGRQARKAKAGQPNSSIKAYRLDSELTKRARSQPTGTSQVIVELEAGQELPAEFAKYAKRRGRLRAINGQVLNVPNSLLAQIGASSKVFRVHHDRAIAKFNYTTSLTVGTRAVQQTLGLTGAGVGVAVIDSGIPSWHDDLTNNTPTMFPFGNQRVAAFVDFVSGQTAPYDDDGHGSHVAGIIAGNGFDSNGVKVGAAPDATLVSLKVLDSAGRGTVSSIIAALDWVLANHRTYNIRVVNLSVGAGVQESAYTDPLTLSAKRVVDAGIVVVSAAGNLGKNSAGQSQYGGITAPANAPWVLTVGASSTNGTPQRTDDTMGGFSSRGPTFLDWAAKPDLVAPGTGTVSLATPGSTFYLTKPNALVAGTLGTSAISYLSLSGTSMAAPVVAGTVALMLQANPSLTPNAVKAILQYTAQQYPGYDALTQGAGFLNAVGAVRLARFYAHAQSGDTVPVQKMWARKIIWGNQRLGSGVPVLTSNAFSLGTTWGVAKTDDGDNIVWGTACGSADCDNIVWGTDDGDNIVWGTANDGDNIVWGTDDGDNIVWGTDCGGADCDNIVWGTDDGDNIVWGTANDGDNIVWGTAVGDNLVWGTADEIEVVWSNSDGDNIVWGTDDGDNIVWGTDDGDNIVWGTDDGDNIVWGTHDGDNIVWGTAGSLSPVWLTTPDGTQTQLSGDAVFDTLKDKSLLRLLQYAPPILNPTVIIVTAEEIMVAPPPGEVVAQVVTETTVVEVVAPITTAEPAVVAEPITTTVQPVVIESAPVATQSAPTVEGLSVDEPVTVTVFEPTTDTVAEPTTETVVEPATVMVVEPITAIVVEPPPLIETSTTTVAPITTTTIELLGGL